LIRSKPLLKKLFHAVIVWSLVPGSGFAAEAGKIVSASESNLVVRGTLTCSDNESKEVPCSEKRSVLALKTEKGQLYLLKDDKLSRTLIEEKRLRTKDFQLTLRKSKDSSSYEIVTSQFFRDGKLYDFYYFCDVCNITTHSPGLCMCCRQETEYHEKLAE
jgi:hypothetical protein